MAFLDYTGLARFKNKITSWRPIGDGTRGQVLRTNGDGTTKWADEIDQTQIGPSVTAWLNTHTPQGETLFVDPTLTMEKAAADAKVVGEMITSESTGLVIKLNN